MKTNYLLTIYLKNLMVMEFLKMGVDALKDGVKNT